MEKKEELNLVSGKVGLMRFDAGSSNLDIPAQVQVISTSEKNRYVDGERTETVEKIALSVLDTKVVAVAERVGVSLSDMPAIFAEIQDPEMVKKLTGQSDKLVGKILSTANASLALRWVAFGRSGGWNGLKLVLDPIQAFSRKESK
ncbi:hypothetical protein [Levilactobacillus spicheri]|uniref:Uncharacterized protein n=1 Tax=Levilactobacillus spicheri TaxID=216463 RepID=A0ABQ0WL47_9LACO|nr:hypothetical protein [Levilactobacillus spicheri]GEO65752.1 hypothetical protein LSP04_01710 [Levilactobacillus spicheri]